MEVEIKLRLPDRAAYESVLSALSASRRATHRQENYFFDSPDGALRARRIVLRVRIYDETKKGLITIKGKQDLVGGVGRASEREVEVDARSARAYLAEPSRMLAEVPLVRELLAAPAPGLGVTALAPLGGFRNLRVELAWEGHVIELDETAFDWGTVHELELETEVPEIVKPKLEAFLSGLGIKFEDAKCSKFANFVNKTLI